MEVGSVVGYMGAGTCCTSTLPSWQVLESLETKSCCHVMYSNQTKCKCYFFFIVQMLLATLATCTYTVFFRISAHLK